MRPYIRFESELPLARNRARLGLFRAAGILEDTFELPDYTQELLRESLDWFNKNLKVPRLSSYRGKSAFWFRTDADKLLERVWELVALLNHEGMFVHQRTTSRPGQITYSDRFQIAAIPERKTNLTFASRV
jgi:hypothetical protein